MKKLGKLALWTYIILLIWILLFKFSLSQSDILNKILEGDRHSINLIPFSLTWSKYEAIANILVFIPLGLLLAGDFIRLSVKLKISIIFLFSFFIESSQYILSLGVPDVTDLLTNGLGGIIGFAIYNFLQTFLPRKKLDRGIIVLYILTFCFLLLGIFYLVEIRGIRIRYF